jgi:hypothetical protein
MSAGLLTFRQAAALIDGFGDSRVAEKRLARLVHSREAMTQKRISTPVRVRGEVRQHQRVTMAALRRHLPELFDPAVAVERIVRREMDSLRQEQVELRAGLNTLEKIAIELIGCMKRLQGGESHRRT